MINEEKLKKFVEGKCYDLLSVKHCYKQACESFQHAANNYTLGIRSSDSINNWLENLKRWEDRYVEDGYLLSQFCHQLGDEYVEIWNEIVGE